MRRQQQSACRHLGPGNYVKLQLLINQAGPSLREVTLVQNQTVAAEAAGTTEFLEPLCPLGVQLAVGLFILRFEHADDFLRRVGEWENQGREREQTERFRIQRESGMESLGIERTGKVWPSARQLSILIRGQCSPL